MKPLLLALTLMTAACGRDGASAGSDGLFSIETVHALDEVARDASRHLLRRQLANGSWGNDYAATALALQALTSVEPPVAAHAAAAEKGLGWLFKRGARGDAENYALAYALAAITARPRMEDRSGLMGRGDEFRDGLVRALDRDCGAFQAAVLLNALSKSGASKERLKELAESAMKRSQPRTACTGRLPDPRNATVRAFVADILSFNAGLPGPGDAKTNFDEIIRHEEFRLPYPTGPLGLNDLLWTTAGFREMRMRLVEPARGCNFSADHLGRHVLALRRKDGTWGGDFAASTALTALVNLRRVFAWDVPYDNRVRLDEAPERD